MRHRLQVLDELIVNKEKRILPKKKCLNKIVLQCKNKQYGWIENHFFINFFCSLISRTKP